jgi:FkbM family methyltransferase
VYEPFVREVFRPKDGEVVVDVGSYIGMYTILASKSVGPLGKVISIEPNPDNFSILMSNIRRNSLTNVVAVPSAAGAEISEANLIVPSQYPAGSLITRAHLPPDEKRSTDEVVHVKSIDSLVRELSIMKVDWIKIDAEGMQTDVLQGCRETLTSFRPKIIIEGGRDVGEYLEELGYTVERLGGASGYVGYLYAYPSSNGKVAFPFGSKQVEVAR